ncbi:unannotated protein [freshwater metagenome]|uniref:Unannotated protein n=1 Tax=freshwater metagenome TaxID=449393 RepID=A0A6J7CRZ7_9ZZZZ|nr:TIGR00645 family protein [Actinomycetota bacterium]
MTEQKQHGAKRAIQATEKGFEHIVFSARWLLAPFYLGMVVALGVLLVKFAQELWHVVAPEDSLNASGVVLAVLSLIDLSLIANLLIIVIFAGYENFISKIDIAKNHPDRPTWMGKVDYGGLKMKVIGSLVAISSIELLKDFIESASGEEPANLKWRIYIHLVFLASGVLFALMDYISAKREVLETEHHIENSSAA